jgi:predicted acetyltransferase
VQYAVRMNASIDVRVEPAAPVDRTLLANLLELYMHDMSAFFPIELGPDGRYGYERLPSYWSAPAANFPFLIRSSGRIAGFALVTRGSPAGEHPDDLDMSEFFVLRSHRRSSIGQRAACMLWDRLPGQWVVRVAERNTPALAFWEKTVRSYTRGAFRQKEHPGKTQMFRVFSFPSANVAHRQDRERAEQRNAAGGEVEP